MIDFPSTKIEDNHRSSLGLGHYFFVPIAQVLPRIASLSQLLA